MSEREGTRRTYRVRSDAQDRQYHEYSDDAGVTWHEVDGGETEAQAWDLGAAVLTVTRHLRVARCLHCPGIFCVTEPCDHEQQGRWDQDLELLRHLYARCPMCGREERLDRLRLQWCAIEVEAEEAE